MDSSYFSHLMVLISIILGLGITEVIASVGAILRNRSRNRKRITLHFPLTMWVLLVCFTQVQFWWAVWGFGDAEITFSVYMLIIFETILHYLLTRLVLPNFASPDVVDEFSVKGYDLQSYYIRNVRWMAGTAVFLIVVIMAGDAWVFGAGEGSAFRTKLLDRVIFIVLLLVVLVTGERERRRAVHEAEMEKIQPIPAGSSGEQQVSTEPRYEFRLRYLRVHCVCTVLFGVALISFVVKHSSDQPGKYRVRSSSAKQMSVCALSGIPVDHVISSITFTPTCRATPGESRNTYTLSPLAGRRTMSACVGSNVPVGYVVTALTSTRGCNRRQGEAYNTYRLEKLGNRTELKTCVGMGIPNGYVVVALTVTQPCRTGGAELYNTHTIRRI